LTRSATWASCAQEIGSCTVAPADGFVGIDVAKGSAWRQIRQDNLSGRCGTDPRGLAELIGTMLRDVVLGGKIFMRTE
jgi:hypothetical protein